MLEPYLATGPRLLVRNGDRRVVEQGAEAGLRVERSLEAGDFVLESASGRRKGSGSFYTPAEITEYLARTALDPLTEPIVESASQDSHQAQADLLALRVCDPAMGSGAFLVQAARALGLALARIRAAAKDGRTTPDMVAAAKRDVVKGCLYGVDLNPLAVVLAKVSLWLETLEKGRPLSFLDAHLRCGDSLVGVDFELSRATLRASELTTWPDKAAKGLVTYLKKEAGERGEPVLEHLKERKSPTKSTQTKLPGTEAWAVEEALAKIAAQRSALVTGDGEDSLQLELETAQAFSELETAEDSLRNRLRAAASFWCAQWFSDGEDAPLDGSGRPVVPAGVDEFETIVAKLLTGDPVPDHLSAQVEATRAVKERRHFFHWALEFPEVIVERGGFDAVIGNPPWNTLSPDVKEFFATYDPSVFRRGVSKENQNARMEELRHVPDIDSAWRTEARFLHQLSAYAKPDSNRFEWYAHDGQLRKGDANVYRLFVERAFKLLREGGHLAQVLPDSVYVASPSTGVRKRLLSEGTLERCYVFENRREIFPIHRSTKVVLLTARRGGGPTGRFKAAFFVGKDAASRDRAVGLEELPDVLADLDRQAPALAVEQIRALAPATWSFPELQTALDAEIAAHCATNLPPLNLDERGWGLKYCAELHADRDARRFKEAAYLEGRGATRDGLRWRDPDGFEWWPLVEGTLFYHLEFPAEGKEPDRWVHGREVASIEARRNVDGSSVMEHYRVAWRLVASTTNERSAVSAVLPPLTAAKHSAPTTWGGSIRPTQTLALAGVISSFCFDYLVRFGGQTNLTHAVLSAVPAPAFSAVEEMLPLVAEVTCCSAEFDTLWNEAVPDKPRPQLDAWEIAERRARIDAEVALAYGLSLEQFAAVLCTFPNLDTIQPMLPGEPKSFVTRDLALLAYCEATETEPVHIDKLLASIGVDLPDPQPEYRGVDARVARYRELGAVPYRPTPRGGRTPTDPQFIEDITGLLGTDAQTAAEIAESLDEEEKTVKAALKRLEKDGEVFAEGRGSSRRYYVIEEGG